MLTTGEVAKLFQVSAQTIINWLDQGRMPFERIGRGPRRLTEEIVLNYIKECGISLTALDQSIYNKILKKIYSSDNQKKEAAVAMLSADLRIVGWNEGARGLTGFSNTNVVGKLISDFAAPHKRGTETMEAILKGDWGKTSKEFEVQHKTHEGRLAYFKLTASKFYAQGQLAGFTLVYQSI